MMLLDRRLTDARVFVETSASANLDDVCRWLIDRHMNPLHLATEDLPALGQGARLKVARPMTARRAVMCALWLVEDVDAGGCLLAGQLRFVAHPTTSEIMVSFSGRTAMAVTSALLYRRAHHAVGQLLQLIAESIQQPAAFSPLRQVAI
jgi:hypothetical protein